MRINQTEPARSPNSCSSIGFISPSSINTNNDATPPIETTLETQHLPLSLPLPPHIRPRPTTPTLLPHIPRLTPRPVPGCASNTLTRPPPSPPHHHRPPLGLHAPPLRAPNPRHDNPPPQHLCPTYEPRADLSLPPNPIMAACSAERNDARSRAFGS